MEYKDEGGNLEQKQDINLNEEEDDIEYYDYEEDNIEHIVQNIQHFLSEQKFSMVACYLGTFSHDLDSERFNYIEENYELLQFICSLSYSIQHTQTIINSIECTSIILKHHPQFSNVLQSIEYLQNLYQNIHTNAKVVSSNMFYNLLRVYSGIHTEYVVDFYPAQCIYDFTQLVGFCYNENMFIYLSLFLHENLIENSAQFLQQIFENSLKQYNVEYPYIGYALRFGIYLMEHHILPETCLPYIENILATNNANNIKQVFDFIGLLAANSVFYTQINIGRVLEIIKHYDVNILRSAMEMFAFHMESRDFFNIFTNSPFLAEFLQYADESTFNIKGPFMILIHALLSKSGSDLCDIEKMMFDIVISYLNSSNDDDYTKFAVETIDILTERVQNPEQINYIFDEIENNAGTDCFEDLLDNEDEDLKIQCERILNKIESFRNQ